MAEQSTRIEYACAHCGGTAVTRDAWAEWDRENQLWTLSETFDFAFCHQCHRETQLATRPATDAAPMSAAPANGSYGPELAEAFRQGARKLAAEGLDDKLEVRDGAQVIETDGDGVLVQCWLYVHDMERGPILGEDYAIEPQRDLFKGEPDGEDGSTCFEACAEADAEIFAVFDVRQIQIIGHAELIEDFPTRADALAFIEQLRAGVEPAKAAA
ncbi:hypothetical protein HNP52_000318 [Sphingomonas kyeonggiensis]|uniref:Uncharacterized protein n=1 Tax=Sphingomonas kyeonggiensis TaxID=1268553 RepID=A0A7W7JYC9_9SPHN|nr:hypothetical protein [Sphingomonas kyeonggiensis]MBB4837267.1 hypothetical protein [Sphingomonas kyeonggiensis]